LDGSRVLTLLQIELDGRWLAPFIGGGAMRPQLRKIFLSGAATAVFFAASAIAANHHSLNGTWKLIADRSDFAGGTMVQSASITINDREHNISISRNFTSEGENTTASFKFDTDARENSTIHQGASFKSKAKWEGDVLKVTTTRTSGVEMERYSMQPDGTLMLVIDRPDHRTLTLYFARESTGRMTVLQRT
jgi:hypothetical protein